MLRTFVDSAGQEWQAFDVIPRAEDRRVYDRRGDRQSSVDDERRDADRRMSVGRTGRLIHIGNRSGWLCFEHGSDRRRLSPIPEDWAQCADAALEQYCNSARPVRRSTSISLDARGGQ